MKLGINGMGRIGRTFFRVLWQNKALEQLKVINDIMPKAHLIYLLQYDTVRGNLGVKINETARGIEVNGHTIEVHQHDRPENIPWGKAQVDTVVEATGIFTKKADLEAHLRAGVKRCLLTTSGGADIPLYIEGVNEADYQKEKIFSIGSCTVNGTAPLVKALQDFSPRSLYVNVIHAYSSRQNILDSYYPELRRTRAAADNIIPLHINLDLSLQRLFPGMKDHISSITSRVPVPCGVLADMTFMLATPPASSAQMVEHLKQKQQQMARIMQVTHDPIVSSDIINDPHSLTIDGEFVQVMDNHVKLMVWFDNEWGFSNRLYDWSNRLNNIE